MADQTVNHGTAEDRNGLLMEIAWELDKIARVLPGLVPIDDDQNHFVVRAFAGRMLRLTDVMMDIGQNEGDFRTWQGIVTLGEGCSQG